MEAHAECDARGGELRHVGSGPGDIEGAMLQDLTDQEGRSPPALLKSQKTKPRQNQESSGKN